MFLAEVSRISIQVAGSCEYGNGLSGSIKCGEFLDLLQNQLASQEGLCSMEWSGLMYCTHDLNPEEEVLAKIRSITRVTKRRS